ncbi:MAG: amphi-Trp domain-containing protein [Magnetococcales bacterium]|nr:amphi-Trp domain-containing protein [Magnetococcales bacterium]
MDKRLFIDKGTKTRQEMAAFLRTVADRVESGAMTLSRGDESLQLDIPQELGFRFNVKDDISRTKTQRKVQIGFRWVLGETKKPDVLNDMVIS